MRLGKEENVTVPSSGSELEWVSRTIRTALEVEADNLTRGLEGPLEERRREIQQSVHNRQCSRRTTSVIKVGCKLHPEELPGSLTWVSPRPYTISFDF